MTLKASKSDLPIDVIKLATGFGAGIGFSGCACGGFTGGIMALGIFMGRTSEKVNWQPSMDISKEFYDRFKAKYGTTCCKAIIRKFGGMFGTARHEHCTVVTADCAAWVIDMAISKGWISENATLD